MGTLRVEKLEQQLVGVRAELNKAKDAEQKLAGLRAELDKAREAEQQLVRVRAELSKAKDSEATIQSLQSDQVKIELLEKELAEKTSVVSRLSREVKQVSILKSSLDSSEKSLAESRLIAKER